MLYLAKMLNFKSNYILKKASKNNFFKNIIFGLILAIIFKSVIHGYLIAILAFFILPFITFGIYSRIFLIIITSVFSIILNLNAKIIFKNIKADWYRSHEAYSDTKSILGSYLPNLNKKHLHRHGDLCELGVLTPAKEKCEFWAGSRISEFKTDEYGFLNNQKINDSDHLLIGDSFLAFSGGDNLSNSIGPNLTKLSNSKRYYQANHPGGFDQYLKRISYFDDILYPKKLPITIFVFEGNDLSTLEKAEPSKSKNILNITLKKILTQFKSAKYTPANKLTHMHYVAFRTKYIPFFDNVEIKEINNQKIGFLKNYIKISQNKKAVLPEKSFELINYVKDRQVCLVFIPTKWSTYLTSSSLRERHPYLAKQLDYLRSKNIEIIDLTNNFQNYTKQLMANSNNDQYLFWSDDTHWNTKGMDYASQIISKNKNCS